MLDDLDRKLILASQAGLPLVRDPYGQMAALCGTSREEVLSRFNRFLDVGIVRRIGVIPHHYRLGYTANGMTVWDVDDAALVELGPAVGQLDFVSHCYRRPRHLPDWPYNLFAMVHGKNREQVEKGVVEINALLQGAVRSSDVLYSTKVLKKTGLRLTE